MDSLSSRLDGKVAIVTGATQAMGIAIARRLAAAGAHVVGSGRSDTGEAAMAEISSTYEKALFVRADLSDEADIDRVVAEATSTFGGVDIVVNNAAAVDSVRAGGDQPIVDLEPDTFRWILDIGLQAPFLLAKKVLPQMVERGSGAFVSISSISAHLAIGGMTAYASSKAALEALTHQIALDYGRAGVRANTITIGVVSVPGNDPLFGDPVKRDMLLSTQMLARRGAPVDVAELTAFLVSDASRFITACDIRLDGGAGAKLNLGAAPTVYSAGDEQATGS